MELGLKIKLFRVAAGLKQQEVAKALGVTVNFISMIERGKRQPTVEFLRRFAKLLKLPASVLLWEPSQSQDAQNGTEDLNRKLTALMAQYAAAIGIKGNRSA